KEDLRADRLRLAASVFRPAARLVLTVTRVRLPFRALADRVLARVELEFQVPAAAHFLELGADHFCVRHLRGSSYQESVVRQLERLGCDLVVADVERGPTPFDRVDSVEVPGRDRFAFRVEG